MALIAFPLALLHTSTDGGITGRTQVSKSLHICLQEKMHKTAS